MYIAESQMLVDRRESSIAHHRK